MTKRQPPHPDRDPIDAYLVERLMQHVDAEVARRRALPIREGDILTGPPPFGRRVLGAPVPPLEVRPAYRSDGALEVRVSMGVPRFLKDSDPGDETP